MKRLTVLTGSGISAECGISTFRDNGGLWEQHNVYDVASIDGWNRDPELLLTFYNERRAQLSNVSPGAAHCGLVDLEEMFDVRIITQNIDDLHERAGNRNILHLHGELTKACCTGVERYTVDIGYDAIKMGHVCPKGHQLRPDIVWFGEDVPNIVNAIRLVMGTDILVIIGTSLAVYPAAGLLSWARPHTKIYCIDPVLPPIKRSDVKHIQLKANDGVAELKSQLM